MIFGLYFGKLIVNYSIQLILFLLSEKFFEEGIKTISIVIISNEF
jgi:hypothetical protein